MIPNDQEFRLFSLLHGDTIHSPLLLAQIPQKVAQKLGWSARNVFLTVKDAQKIIHHPMHGMNAQRGLALPLVIRQGDYYSSQIRGTELQIEVVLHELNNPKRAYFLVLARDKEDSGIFIRTFYFNAALSRNKMKSATPLRINSTVNYFKQVRGGPTFPPRRSASRLSADVGFTAFLTQYNVLREVTKVNIKCLIPLKDSNRQKRIRYQTLNPSSPARSALQSASAAARSV